MTVMRHFFFMVLLAGLMITPVGLMAQEVYKQAKSGALGGYSVILDMTETTGMPAGAVTNVKKYIGSYTASNENWLINATDNLHDGSINATLYQKLEIAPKDMNTSANIDGTGTLAMSWNDAYNHCKSSTYNGGGWRLPTQRELMMIWTFKPALESIFGGIGGTMFDTGIYWGATECIVYNAWNVNFSSGYTDNYTKTVNFRVRCVREL